MNKPDFSGTLLDICLSEARKSPCKKLGFGAILWRHGTIIGVEHNRPFPETEFVCTPECIRNSIQSRTQSMIGACAHAEERLIFSVSREQTNDAEIFVAGVKLDGTPLEKARADFSCIRCATAMLHAGIRGVWVFVDGDWEFVPTEAAYQTALEYALGKRTY